MTNQADTNPPNDLDDYRWLVSDEAGPWIELAARTDRPVLAIAQRLRKQLSPGRVHLVLEQVELRRRAARSGKFDNVDRMFFTAKLYEQSSSHRVAQYKSKRFATGASVADLCCGLGGDLMALINRGPAAGVDRDPVAALLAEVNCRSASEHLLDVTIADATQFPVGDFDAWHIDPDRRPAGRRTSRPELHEPNLEQIDRVRQRSPSAVIKLAPAANIPEHWAAEADLEWIGETGECKQLVAWFGKLAHHPGRRAATILQDRTPAAVTVTGSPNQAVLQAQEVGRFIFEPHSAVLAARLAGDLAAQHDLRAASADYGYLTGDQPIDDPALTAFEVTDTMPFDMKRLKAALRTRKLGRLEIKKRRLDVNPETVRRQLRVPGEERGVLLLTRFRDRALAILAKRL